MSRRLTPWARRALVVGAAVRPLRGALVGTRASRLVPAALVAVAVAWGVSFVVIKDALASVAPGDLVGWRFAVAAVVLVMLRPRSVIMNRRTVGSGAALGVLLGLGFVLCAYGMQSTSVVASAFIVGSTVVITPVVARLWLGRRLSPRMLVATGLATAGLMLLTLRGVAIGGGAVLILLAAVLFAVHLCALGRWVSAEQISASTLVQLVTAAGVALLVGLVVDGDVRLPPPAALGGILYLGAVATAAAFLVVTWAQTRTDATTTAILLTLEPVVGGAAGVVLGEPITVAAVAGALAVLAASGLVTIGATEPVMAQDEPRADTAASVPVPGPGSRLSAAARSTARPAPGAARLSGHRDRPAVRVAGAGDRVVRRHAVHR